MRGYDDLDYALYARLLAGKATAEDQRALAFYMLSHLPHLQRRRALGPESDCGQSTEPPP